MPRVRREGERESERPLAVQIRLLTPEETERRRGERESAANEKSRTDGRTDYTERKRERYTLAHREKNFPESGEATTRPSVRASLPLSLSPHCSEESVAWAE